MNIAIYARYSTDLQDKTSIAGQVANCEALAAREGLNVVKRIHDEGRSGNDDARVGYRELLASLTTGEIDGVICDETSRLTRNQAELHRFVAEIRFRDQFLLTVDGVDTRSEASEIILSVKAAIDQMEGRKIGTRTYRSLRERHKAGHCVGGRIYGYSSVEDGDYKRRVVNPDQAEVICEIFERYAAGEGGKSIARALNDRGVPSPGSFWNHHKRRAVGWTHTTILGSYSKASGILRNPIYRGDVTWNKRKGRKVPGTNRRVQTRRPDDEWIGVQDETLRIVSDELWNKVQAKLKATRAKTHPNNRGGRPARYLLSGVMVCSSCGGRYVIRNGRDYCCSSHTNGRDSLCEQRRTIRRETVEQNLLQGIKDELLAPSVLKEITKRVRARVRNAKKPDKRKACRELETVERQIEDAVDTILEIGRSDALSRRLATLEARKAGLERIVSAEAPTEIVPNVEGRITELVSGLEKITHHPKADADLIAKARTAIRDALGEVTITENQDGVFADIQPERLCITVGAQERT